MQQHDGIAAMERLVNSGDPLPQASSAPTTRSLSASWSVRSPAARGPRRPRITGFDDVPMAALVSPSLTTVRQPVRELGATAARRLLQAATGDAPSPEPACCRPSLVLRAVAAVRPVGAPDAWEADGSAPRDLDEHGARLQEIDSTTEASPVTDMTASVGASRSTARSLSHCSSAGHSLDAELLGERRDVAVVAVEPGDGRRSAASAAVECSRTRRASAGRRRAWSGPAWSTTPARRGAVVATGRPRLHQAVGAVAGRRDRQLGVAELGQQPQRVIARLGDATDGDQPESAVQQRGGRPSSSKWSLATQ